MSSTNLYEELQDAEVESYDVAGPPGVATIEDSCIPKKTVLGKDNARKRLKAFSIQKKQVPVLNTNPSPTKPAGTAEDETKAKRTEKSKGASHKADKKTKKESMYDKMVKNLIELKESREGTMRTIDSALANYNLPPLHEIRHLSLYEKDLLVNNPHRLETVLLIKNLRDDEIRKHLPPEPLVVSAKEKVEKANRKLQAETGLSIISEQYSPGGSDNSNSPKTGEKNSKFEIKPQNIIHLSSVFPVENNKNPIRCEPIPDPNPISFHVDKFGFLIRDPAPVAPINVENKDSRSQHREKSAEKSTKKHESQHDHKKSSDKHKSSSRQKSEDRDRRSGRRGRDRSKDRRRGYRDHDRRSYRNRDDHRDSRHGNDSKSKSSDSKDSKSSKSKQTSQDRNSKKEKQETKKKDDNHNVETLPSDGRISSMSENKITKSGEKNDAVESSKRSNTLSQLSYSPILSVENIGKKTESDSEMKNMDKEADRLASEWENSYSPEFSVRSDTQWEKSPLVDYKISENNTPLRCEFGPDKAIVSYIWDEYNASDDEDEELSPPVVEENRKDREPLREVEENLKERELLREVEENLKERELLREVEENLKERELLREVEENRMETPERPVVEEEEVESSQVKEAANYWKDLSEACGPYEHSSDACYRKTKVGPVISYCENVRRCGCRAQLSDKMEMLSVNVEQIKEILSPAQHQDSVEEDTSSVRGWYPEERRALNDKKIVMDFDLNWENDDNSSQTPCNGRPDSKTSSRDSKTTAYKEVRKSSKDSIVENFDKEINLDLSKDIYRKTHPVIAPDEMVISKNSNMDVAKSSSIKSPLLDISIIPIPTDDPHKPVVQASEDNTVSLDQEYEKFMEAVSTEIVSTNKLDKLPNEAGTTKSVDGGSTPDRSNSQASDNKKFQNMEEPFTGKGSMRRSESFEQRGPLEKSLDQTASLDVWDIMEDVGKKVKRKEAKEKKKDKHKDNGSDVEEKTDSKKHKKTKLKKKKITSKKKQGKKVTKKHKRDSSSSSSGSSSESSSSSSSSSDSDSSSSDSSDKANESKKKKKRLLKKKLSKLSPKSKKKLKKTESKTKEKELSSKKTKELKKHGKKKPKKGGKEDSHDKKKKIKESAKADKKAKIDSEVEKKNVDAYSSDEEVFKEVLLSTKLKKAKKLKEKMAKKKLKNDSKHKGKKEKEKKKKRVKKKKNESSSSSTSSSDSSSSSSSSDSDSSSEDERRKKSRKRSKKRSQDDSHIKSKRKRHMEDEESMDRNDFDIETLMNIKQEKLSEDETKSGEIEGQFSPRIQQKNYVQEIISVSELHNDFVQSNKDTFENVVVKKEKDELENVPMPTEVEALKPEMETKEQTLIEPEKVATPPEEIKLDNIPVLDNFIPHKSLAFEVSLDDSSSTSSKNVKPVQPVDESTNLSNNSSQSNVSSIQSNKGNSTDDSRNSIESNQSVGSDKLLIKYPKEDSIKTNIVRPFENIGAPAPVPKPVPLPKESPSHLFDVDDIIIKKRMLILADPTKEIIQSPVKKPKYTGTKPLPSTESEAELEHKKRVVEELDRLKKEFEEFRRQKLKSNDSERQAAAEELKRQFDMVESFTLTSKITPVSEPKKVEVTAQPPMTDIRPIPTVTGVSASPALMGSVEEGLQGEIKWDWRPGTTAPTNRRSKPSRWGVVPKDHNQTNSTLIEMSIKSSQDLYEDSSAPPHHKHVDMMTDEEILQMQAHYEATYSVHDDSNAVYSIPTISSMESCDNMSRSVHEVKYEMYSEAQEMGYVAMANPDHQDDDKKSKKISLDERINLVLQNPASGGPISVSEEGAGKEVPPSPPQLPPSLALRAPPPIQSKGILILGSVKVARLDPRAPLKCKKVCFSDGLAPGMDSDLEDPLEPPTKKSKGSKKSKRKCGGHSYPCPPDWPDYHPLYDTLPPPPPPPGSPPLSLLENTCSIAANKVSTIMPDAIITRLPKIPSHNETQLIM